MNGLDGLRGVAAISAMFFHAHVSILPAPHGYRAVDFFFVLSGYVIARSYEPMLASQPTSASRFGHYFLLRLQRLYPMLFLGGLVGLFTYAIGLTEYRAADQSDLARAMISQFLLIPFLSAGGFFPINRVQWTIVMELMVNAAHAILLPWLKTWALCAIIVVALAGVMYARSCSIFTPGCSADPYPVRLFSRPLFGFFLGVLLCRTQPRWLPAMPEVSFTSLAVSLFVLLCLPMDWTRQGIGFVVFEILCLTVLFPLIIMLGARGRAGKVADALGTVSYPLYAIHLPVIIALRNGGVGEGLAIVAIFGLILVAWAIGYWIDEPLNARRHRLRRLALNPPPPSTAAAPAGTARPPVRGRA